MNARETWGWDEVVKWARESGVTSAKFSGDGALLEIVLGPEPGKPRVEPEGASVSAGMSHAEKSALVRRKIEARFSRAVPVTDDEQ